MPYAVGCYIAGPFIAYIPFCVPREFCNAEEESACCQDTSSGNTSTTGLWGIRLARYESHRLLPVLPINVHYDNSSIPCVKLGSRLGNSMSRNHVGFRC